MSRIPSVLRASYLRRLHKQCHCQCLGGGTGSDSLIIVFRRCAAVQSVVGQKHKCTWPQSAAPRLTPGTLVLPACTRSYSSLSPREFERVSEETLESLCEKFEELNELDCCPEDFDVTYSGGVLTAKIGAGHGTYVINKQTPNSQIWLSSPRSGPKRYDYVGSKWIYKHDDSNLHALLSKELNAVFGDNADFKTCSYSGAEGS